MQIHKLQVEEGFLDGLDLEFAPGLNVLIGPRGAGKTSVIEVIRFCLGVEPFTQKGVKEARQHALSVLGSSGKSVVTMSVNGESVRVERAVDDVEPRFSVPAEPIILSQNEIESIGVDADGRLRVIDDFRARQSSTNTDSVVAQIRSLSVQLHELTSELILLGEQHGALSKAPEELKAAQAAEAEIAKNLAQAAPTQRALDELGQTIAGLSVRRAVLERVESAINEWHARLSEAVTRKPTLEEWPQAAQSPDPLGPVREAVQRASALVSQAVDDLEATRSEVDALRALERESEAEQSDRAREMRRELERIQEGAGDASRRTGALRERVGQLSALTDLLEQRRRQVVEIQERRLALLDALDRARDERFHERQEIARHLNQEFGPRIEIQIDRDGAMSEYASTIAGLLRGSQLHYGTLAPQLAEKLSPRELAEAIERNDAAAIVTATGIAPDRAQRLIDHIKSVGTADLLVAPIDDAVELSLLDGKIYKPSDALSTGQRCTVVLPILLTHRDCTVVVDEPEAHLDNAFVVGTVIRALQGRSPGAQFILATHNANIPVLGEADKVVLLGSDGRRGFVRSSGRLDEPETVEAITSVMEGGREAFRTRAEFYETHGGELGSR